MFDHFYRKDGRLRASVRRRIERMVHGVVEPLVGFLDGRPLEDVLRDLGDDKSIEGLISVVVRAVRMARGLVAEQELVSFLNLKPATGALNLEPDPMIGKVLGEKYRIIEDGLGMDAPALLHGMALSVAVSAGMSTRELLEATLKRLEDASGEVEAEVDA